MAEEKLDNVERILNIKKGEPFRVKTWAYEPYVYNGFSIINCKNDHVDGDYILSLLNHPERIEKLPQKIVVPKAVWALLKAWQKYGAVLVKQEGCFLYAFDDEILIGHIRHEGKLFESNVEIKIADILDSGRYVEGEN
jgi:hypothetical protein